MRKPLPDYSAFSVTDFVLDPDFVRWVKDPSDRDTSFWEAWLSHNPEKNGVVQDARILIKYIRYETDFNTQENLDQTWNILSEKFDQHENKVTPMFLSAKFFMRFAAAVSLLAIAGGLIWFQMAPESTSRTYKTGNGQTATFKLSDSSQVVLNANSSLRITMHSGWNPRREAWIEGEAFFKIKKLKSRAAFTVHTSHVNVNVLGTEFNVTNRRDVSTVVLQTGKIKISNTVGEARERIMQPGELALFSDTSTHFQVRQVRADQYSSWIYNQLVFDHTSISDVAQMLEDNYGFSVVISKPALAKKTFSATLPSNSLPILLKALEESFNVSITQLDKKLIISDKQK